MSERQQAAASRPFSDVSAAVGRAGLFGLFAWITLCRNWLAIAAASSLPGARCERRSRAAIQSRRQRPWIVSQSSQ
jgi:hypothetical protein